MLKPFEPQHAVRIVDNILDACKDITRLSVDGYRWISIRAGFIAHYNKEGFITDYQTSQNIRDNILVYEHANIHCNRSVTDIEYPYYQQQCDMYARILDNLKANPADYQQEKQIEHFYIEFEWYPGDDLHRITLCSNKGTARVLADKQYLLSLVNNIYAHLQESDELKSRLL